MQTLDLTSLVLLDNCRRRRLPGRTPANRTFPQKNDSVSIQKITKCMSMSQNLYLVTGASGYIGSAIVIELLKNKENVVFGFDSKSFPEELLKKNNPSGAFHDVIGDVLSEAALLDLREKLAAQQGDLHGIVNCFCAPEAPIKTKYSYQTDPEIDMPGEKRSLAIIDVLTNYANQDFLKELEINLVGLHNVIRNLTPEILKSRNVSIVNFASTYGIKVPNQDLFTNRKKFVCKLPGYSTSKAGVISYTEYMASIFSGREAKNLVRFNCIAPGNLIRNHNEEFIKNYVRLTWNSRMPNIEDVISGVMFLLSPSSSYINGTTLEIDSGLVRK